MTPCRTFRPALLTLSGSPGGQTPARAMCRCLGIELGSGPQELCAWSFMRLPGGVGWGPRGGGCYHSGPASRVVRGHEMPDCMWNSQTGTWCPVIALWGLFLMLPPAGSSALTFMLPKVPLQFLFPLSVAHRLSCSSLKNPKEQ